MLGAGGLGWDGDLRDLAVDGRVSQRHGGVLRRYELLGVHVHVVEPGGQ
jgi:hypothetical protein